MVTGLLKRVCAIALVGAIASGAIAQYRQNYWINLDPLRPPTSANTSQALAMRSLQALDRGDLALAAALARQSLSANPFGQSTLTVLAIAETANAEKRLALSARLGWRDPLTQTILAEAAVAGNEPIEFATRFDAIARTQISPVVANPTIEAILAQPAYRDALADRIALRPLWREAFLANFAPGTTPDMAWRWRLFESLAARGAPVTARELTPLIAQLRHNNLEDFAWETWKRHATAPDEWSGLVHDGAFKRFGQSMAGPVPWEWSVPDASDGTAEIAENGGHAVLRLGAPSGSLAPILRQTVRLLPGRYLLSVETVAGEPLDAMHVRLDCLDRNLGLLPLQTGSATTLRFAADASCPYATITIAADGALGSTEPAATLKRVTIAKNESAQ